MRFRFNTPDISNLGRGSASRTMFEGLFLGTGSISRKALVFLLNYLRLVDLAIEEYELGRAELDRISKGDDPGAAQSCNPTLETMPDGSVVARGGVVATSFPYQFMRATGHMEVCVLTTKRALFVLNAMREHVPEFSVEGRDVHFGDDLDHRVGGLRRVIEHREGLLISNNSDALIPAFLELTADGLELTGHKVSYADLTRCLTILRGIGTSLRGQARASVAKPSPQWAYGDGP